MKINQKFNTFTQKEYVFYMENHEKYTDFNTLGLYRSIIENEKLDIAAKIEVRDFANTVFQKTFDFLQIKDPYTYVKLVSLGKELTVADERQIWKNVFQNQQKILADKKIKHRNFGEYSKHSCGYETCPMNGIMIKQDSRFAEMHMRFESDSSSYPRQLKSERLKKERKNQQQTIKKILEEDVE